MLLLATGANVAPLKQLAARQGSSIADDMRGPKQPAPPAWRAIDDGITGPPAPPPPPAWRAVDDGLFHE